MDSWLPWVVATGVAIAAGVLDGRTGRIPNGLTLPSLVAAPIFRFVFEGPGGVFAAGLGMLLVGVVPLTVYIGTSGRGIGGGDVKLLAALGAWLGPGLGLEMQLAAWTIALLGACALLARRGRLLATWRGVLRLVVRRRPGASHRVPEAFTSMRLGPAIAAGTLFAVVARALEDWPP